MRFNAPGTSFLLLLCYYLDRRNLYSIGLLRIRSHIAVARLIITECLTAVKIISHSAWNICRLSGSWLCSFLQKLRLFIPTYSCTYASNLCFYCARPGHRSHRGYVQLDPSEYISSNAIVWQAHRLSLSRCCIAGPYLETTHVWKNLIHSSDHACTCHCCCS